MCVSFFADHQSIEVLMRVSVELLRNLHNIEICPLVPILWVLFLLAFSELLRVLCILTFEKSRYTELSEVLKRLTKIGPIKWVPKGKSLYCADSSAAPQKLS